MINFSILINTFSSIPNGCLIDLLANSNVILVHLNSFRPNYLSTVKRIKDTLVPRSQRTLGNSMLSMVQKY